MKTVIMAGGKGTRISSMLDLKEYRSLLQYRISVGGGNTKNYIESSFPRYGNIVY